MTHAYAPVLSFWFGELDADGRADEIHARRWFTKDPVFDETLHEVFGGTHAAVAAGECNDWLGSAHGRLAFVIVLDQLSRNLFRGTAEMFAHDGRALEVALEGIERGADRSLAHDERSFLYMPLMHSEDLATQNRCVALFAAWRDELSGPTRDHVANQLRYAEQHRDIIARFGRFPHRNEMLGRPSTDEEVEFLKRPGASF